MDVATVPEANPLSERVTSPTSPPPSRWHTFVGSVPTQTDDAPSEPGPVDTFPEPDAADATPTRTTDSDHEVKRRVDTSPEVRHLGSGTIESIAEVEIPVALEAQAPIPDVVVETDATVTEAEPTSNRVAPPGPKRGSRYEKLLASAPSRAASARDDGGTLVEPDTAVTTPTRTKGRRRRARVDRRIDATHGATLVGTTAELTSEHPAPPVDAAASLMAEVVELDTATATATGSESARVAQSAQEHGSRWDTLVAPTPARPMPNRSTSTHLPIPARPNRSAKPRSQSTSRPSPKRNRHHNWRVRQPSLGAAGTNSSPPEPARSTRQPRTSTAAPEPDQTATPKRTRSRRRRTKVERRIDTNDELSVVEPKSPQPVAEIDGPVADATAVDVTPPTSELESEPGAALHGSRWDNLVASAAPIDTTTDNADALDETGETRTTPRRIRRRRRGTKVERRIDTNDELSVVELQSPQPIAEIDAPVVAEDPVDVTELAAEPTSQPQPVSHGSRWDRLVASPTSQIDNARLT